LSKIRFIGIRGTAEGAGSSQGKTGQSGTVVPVNHGPASEFPLTDGILTIPAGVRRIPAEAFRGRRDIFAVEFEAPCALETIERAAFCDCDELREVRFPETCPLREVGEDAFRRCTALQSLRLPEGTEELGDNSFSECTSLLSLHLPASLETIGRGAFSLCFRLHSVQIPDTVSAIGDEAFFLSRKGGKYIRLDFGRRSDFSGIHENVLLQSHHCPRCGRPFPWLNRGTCACGANLGR